MRRTRNRGNWNCLSPLLFIAFFCSPTTLVRAQTLLVASGATIYNPGVPSTSSGLSVVETDYEASLYYYPRTDGFLLTNGQITVSRSVRWTGNNGTSCLGPVNGYQFPGYFCLLFTMNYPALTVPSTSYVTQTNGWITPYYTQVISNITYYDDPFGYGFDSPIAGGNGQVGPNANCYSEFINTGGICNLETAGDLYVGYVQFGFVTPPGPTLGGIQVDGVATNTIIAGTSGYMAIYGQNLSGATSVNPPPGVTITSYAVYNNGTQINAFFVAAQTAGTGQHNITVTTGAGTSNGSPTVTVAVNVTKFVFTNSIPYSRDCAGAASAISSPTWPAPTGVTCPQKLGYSGDHAVYASGTTMQGTATFRVSPAPLQAVTGMYVQGAIPGIGNFTASGVSIMAGVTTFSAGVTANAALLSGKTQFYNPMNVAWSAGQSGSSCSSGCASVGASSNPVYVSLAKPIALPVALGPLTLSYVALGVGSGGASSQSTAVNNTWSYFSSLASPANVKTWDGRAMYYYSQGFVSCAFTPLPLVETTGTPSGGSGQCGAFAFLLEASLAANGIHSTWIRISPTDAPSTNDKMVIKNWTFGSPSYPSSAPWVYKFILGTPDYMVPPLPSYGNLTNNQPTLKGQNTAPPVEKVFDSHFIVQIPIVSGNQYYDPSYGVTYASASDFESKAIAGYAKQIPGVDTGGNYHLRLPAPPSNITFTPVPGNSL